MTLARLFAPAIVLGVWSLAWAVDLRSAELVGAFLVLLTIAVVVAEVERVRQRRER